VAYITYCNVPNKKINLHLDTCNQLEKHGGISSVRLENQEYLIFQEKQKALDHLDFMKNNFGFNANPSCSFCNP
jgi:hypothetical protein